MIETGILAEGAKCELIDGELLEMPAEGPIHLVLAHRLSDQLRDCYREWGFWVRMGAPVVLADDSWPEPDVSVIAGPDSQYLERHPRGDECVLVVEVCYSSHARDHEKVKRYGKAGVPEYWILDVPGRELEVYKEPCARGGYLSMQRIPIVADSVAYLPRTMTQRIDFDELFGAFP
jgi:Uma2 family endonuclease